MHPHRFPTISCSISVSACTKCITFSCCTSAVHAELRIFSRCREYADVLPLMSILLVIWPGSVMRMPIDSRLCSSVQVHHPTHLPPTHSQQHNQLLVTGEKFQPLLLQSQILPKMRPRSLSEWLHRLRLPLNRKKAPPRGPPTTNQGTCRAKGP
ncbi:hypothetical protein EDB19DRAFT_1807389, partial [Suillus lakei]